MNLINGYFGDNVWVSIIAFIYMFSQFSICFKAKYQWFFFLYVNLDDFEDNEVSICIFIFHSYALYVVLSFLFLLGQNNIIQLMATNIN